MRFCFPVATLFLAAMLGSAIPLCVAGAQQPTPAQLRFFETKVRPILTAQCFKCHGPQKQKGGLRLDSRTAVLEGGDSGPAVVPGKPEKSLLVEAINHIDLKMPKGGKLKDAEIAALTDWVRMGAPWPAETARNTRATSRITGEDRSHWSFRAVRSPRLPDVVDDGWSNNPIDRLILQKLRAEGLTPANAAGRVTLIRRVSFDLIGRPPTPPEIDTFLADKSPDAYEVLVERLLASPQYGERWARHWLDLARYADSDGYRIDDYRPNAWRYRDYIIHAFNADKPYDRLVQEQLAGDELFPDNPEALVATGYLRHWIYEYNNRDVRGQWHTILNDITDTTGDVFLGLGIQCARCHDHKFDPILQKDYYRLQAFFAPILPREDIAAATQKEIDQYRARLTKWEFRTADLRRQIEEIEAPHRKAATEDAISKFPDDIQAMIRKPVAERTPLEHQLAELAYRQVTYEHDRPDRWLKGAAKERVLALRKQLAAFDVEKPAPLPLALVVTDVGRQAPPVFIPRKGERADHAVEPGFLTIFEERPATIPSLDTIPHSTGRRAALARWLTRPDNPLTVRVIVNRVWQHHFGRGLAVNPSDFGRLGDPPSHAELLDWLATRFIRDGWSIKRLHRLIVTSATYRQSSRHPRAAVYRVKDPDNRFLWRGSTRRLDAEQIRDALLAVTGELDRAAGGPAVKSNVPRRTIYSRVLRNTRDPLLEVFDLPYFISSVPSRDTTTTPVQSLLLLNSATMLARAQAFARRLEREVPADEGSRIRHAYRLAFGRRPEPEETMAALLFLKEQRGRIDPVRAASGADVRPPLRLPAPVDAGRQALRDFCHVLLNSSEFLYVD
jgi:hypothetical protein